MKTTLTIGEAMGLFVADELGKLEEVSKFTKYTAGADMNVAVGLSRLGFNSYYSTVLGVDPLATYIKDFLVKENVNTEYVYNNDEYLTGFMFKAKVEDGDPGVSYFRKNSAASHFDKEQAKDIDMSKFDLFHATGITIALSDKTREMMFDLKARAIEAGKVLTFDPNIRPTLWASKEEMIKTTNEYAKGCDVVLPGISEGEILTGSSEPSEIADFYINLGVKKVIVKVGAKGAYYKTVTGEEGFVDGFKVETVVDTVGAGDGFATGIISGILDDCSIEETCKRGCGIGAIQVMHKSDNEGLPTREELFDFMKRG